MCIHGCTLSHPPLYHALLRTVIRTSIRIKLRVHVDSFPGSHSNSRSLSSSDGSNSFLSCWLTPPALRNYESIRIFLHAWVVGELEREREYSQNGNGNESQERERVMRMSLSAAVCSYALIYRVVTHRDPILLQCDCSKA